MGGERIIIPVEPETPAQVFDVVLRGYDRGQVDRWVAGLEDELAELRFRAESVAALQAELVEQRTKVAADRERFAAERDAWQPSFAELGERAAQMLTLAQDEAEALRARAEQEAAQLRELTQREMADLRRRAQAAAMAEQRRAESMVEAAQVAAARIATEAAAQAEAIRRDAHDNVATLRRERADLVADLGLLAERLNSLATGGPEASEQDAAEVA
jgi:cell division septum initiation protein DivIVA